MDSISLLPAICKHTTGKAATAQPEIESATPSPWDMFFPPLPLSRSLWMASAKKWKVSSVKKPSRIIVKPVEAAGGEGDERAIVLALPVDMSSPLQPQVVEQSRMVMMDASLFHCASCSQILKPPTFKCAAGHVVCKDCRASHAEVCSDAAGSFIRCPDMDRMVRTAKAFCVHKDRGCTRPVPYHELADHLRCCRFAPPSGVVSSNLDSGDTAAAPASGSPTPAPATRPKRDRRPNPRYTDPSLWTK